MPQKSLSFDYVDENTEYYKYLANEQYTIPRNEKGYYDGVLNKRGQNLYDWIKNMIAKKSFKGKITDGLFVPLRSGFLKDNGENCTVLNSWNNRTLLGRLNEKELQTSVVLLFEYLTPTTGWAYTISGSLYEFELNE